MVDQGGSYTSKELRGNLDAADVQPHEALVGNSGTIGMVERYHAPLHTEGNKIKAGANSKIQTRTVCRWQYFP